MNEAEPSRAKGDGPGDKDSGQPRLDDLAPGDVVDIVDLNELVAFEDVVAADVAPGYDIELWASRPHLRDLLRPEKFNGTIAEISLVVIPDPYERLLDANERGWRAQPHGGRLGEIHRLSSSTKDRLLSRYHEFTFTADARSSGRGSIGQIQAELWYFPVPPAVVKAGKVIGKTYVTRAGEVKTTSSVLRNDSVSRRDKGLGVALSRVVTKPRIEREKFINLREASRRIGLSQLRQSLISYHNTYARSIDRRNRPC